MNIASVIATITLVALVGLPGSPSHAADDAAIGAAASGEANSGARARQMAPAKGKQSGMHSMIGKVEDLDTETGMLELKTAEGPLKLHFPPQSLTQLKKGDEIQVHLGFTATGK